MTTRSKTAKKRSARPAPKNKTPTDPRASEPTRIGEFIQRQILGAQPDGPPVRLVLRHLEPKNKLGQRIGSQNIMKLSEEDISAMAVGVYDIAESDAIGLGDKLQRYVLLSFDEYSHEPIGRCVFEIPARDPCPDDHAEFLDSDDSEQKRRDALDEYQKGLESAWEFLRGHYTEAFVRGVHDGFNAKEQMIRAEKARLAKEVK